MKVEVKGKKVVIELDMEEEPQLSKTGRTLSIASSRGNKETAVKVNGKPLYVGVNCYIYATEKVTVAGEKVEKSK